MTNKQVREQTGVGTSAPVVMNAGGPDVGLCVLVSGTVTYTVEHTFGNGVWFPHESLVDKIANADGNYAFPVEAVRVNVTAGTGTVTLITMQAR